MQQKARVSDPQVIRQALEDLRQASLRSAGPGLPPVRATVLNLVAYAGDRARAAEMAGQVAALVEQHPSRAIFLGAEPGSDAKDWDIHVSSRCHPAVPGYLVCIEVIEIIARGQAVERLPAIALSLLLRDLPVLLWWPGDVPFGTPLFERLMFNSDRLLVDTASASNPEALLRRLAALGHAEHCPCTVSDFNWGRLTPWRELTAQFFDSPECWPCLERLDQVRLELAGRPERPDWTQALLLAAWLATRLGWAPAATVWSDTPEGDQVNLIHGQRLVSIEFVHLPVLAGSPGLRHVGLRAALAEGPAILTVRRPVDGGQAEVTARLPNREDWRRIVPFPEPGPIELLGDELRRSGYDPIYQDALRMAAYLSAQRQASPSPQPAPAPLVR